MSTRLKKLLHIRTDHEDLEHSASLERRATRRVRPSIPTLPYCSIEPASPPRTSKTALKSPILQQFWTEKSIASPRTEHTHRFKRLSFFERPKAPPLPPKPIPTGTRLLSAIQVGPDFATELKSFTIPNEQLVSKCQEAATRKISERSPYRPARTEHLAFFQSQQQYAELVASRKAHLSQHSHPALRSRSQAQAAKEELPIDLSTPPPIPERDQSRPRYQPSDFLKEPSVRTTSVSSSSDRRSFHSTNSEPSIRQVALAQQRSPVLVIQERRLSSFNTDILAVSPKMAAPIAIEHMLESTEDVTYEKHMAPAVVHETVIPHVHHIRYEHITREIHEHEVHVRTLPVIDVQVLPARHYVLASELQAIGAKPIHPHEHQHISNHLPPNSNTSASTSPTLTNNSTTTLPLRPPPPPPKDTSNHNHHHSHNHNRTHSIYLADTGKTINLIPHEALSLLHLIEVDPTTLPAKRQSRTGHALHPGLIDYGTHPAVLEAKQNLTPLPLLVPLATSVGMEPEVGYDQRLMGESGAMGGFGADGIRRTETTWKHPAKMEKPVLEEEFERLKLSG